MKATIGAAALMAALSMAPVQSASAQDAPLIGGLLGAGAGAAIGGAVGGSVGAAVAGGIIGGATGALIGAATQPRPGYYAYRSRCYVQVGYNQYRRVSSRHCY